jgi:hypothetical protein
MAQGSRGALDALFGEQPGNGESTRPAAPASLDDLFKK